VCAPAAKAQLTWTITVSEPSSGTKPKYDLSCQQAGTPVACPNTDPTVIDVNRNDAVYWQIGSNIDELWIVHEDAIVDDASGKATHLHHAKKGAGGQDGGNVDMNATVSATTAHKYYVFAYDHTKILYYDDPRIIIGTGLVTSLNAIEINCNALVKKLENSPGAKDARDLCQQIKALEESLRPKKEK
jgi:hypothetical protein